MKVKLFSLLLLAGLLSLFSCKKDETPAGLGHYTQGVFIVNEGPSAGAGSISWHHPETGETVQDVFSKANNGAVLGKFVQSLTLHNGKGYIVVNGANKVYVVDAVTFKFIDTIGGLALPRFMLPLNDDLALFSQWGADGLTGSVAQVDLLTRQVVGTSPTGKGPEKMILDANNFVLVANSGGFGVDSTISQLNFGGTTELTRITVPGKNPGSIAFAPFVSGPFGGPATFVHCKGSFLDANPAGWVGALGEVGNAIPAYGDDLVAAPDGNWLYFTAGGKIYRIGVGGMEAWLDQVAYGLGCDPKSGNIYCADAKDFNSAGEVVVYNPAGQRIGAFPVGVAPSEIVFIP